MDLPTASLLGAAGGLIPDVLRAISKRYEGPPDYLSSWYFWASLVILAVIGGGASYLLEPQSTISALAIGYSAPSIISNLLGTPPNAPSLAERLPERLRDQLKRSMRDIPRPLGGLWDWWGK